MVVGGIGEQEAPAQHLLDENVGQSVYARLPGPSAVTSSSGHGRPDQTFITAEREEEMVEGCGRGGAEGRRALKIQQAAAEERLPVGVVLDWNGSLEDLRPGPREDGSNRAQGEVCF